MDVAGIVGNISGGAAKDTKGLNQDFDQFLRLLTTQLQNQDPMQPMDSSEFTNQLVQFSNVEQQIKSNDYLEKMLTLQTLNLTSLGLGFIGKDVEVAGDTFKADGTHDLNFAYDMPEDAITGSISVLDASNNPVHTLDAELSKGRHNFVWDGKDQYGQPVPAGTYHLSIGALRKDQTALNVTSYVPGHVDGLESGDDGNIMLMVGGQKVSITDVRKVSEAN